MSLVSVIIPYFQREPGVLARSLQSVSSQRLPDGWQAEIVIIDDGSPRAARDELLGIHFPLNIRPRIVEQENGGAASARNRGLNESSPETTLIAFLDSDDSWPQDHLAIAIQAHICGHDLSFTDNFREGYHDSCVEHCCPKTRDYLTSLSSKDGLIELSVNRAVQLFIEEMPAQTSTIVYRVSIDPHLRFDDTLETCGEDMLFFVTLLAKSERICFNQKTKVICGKGMNIYFGQLNWDSKAFLAIKADQVVSHKIIASVSFLDAQARKANKRKLHRFRCDFAFHTLRYLLKQRRIPPVLHDLSKRDHRFYFWYPVCLCSILLRYPLGLYKP